MWPAGKHEATVDHFRHEYPIDYGFTGVFREFKLNRPICLALNY
jgi:hypothetical protein